MTDRAADTPSDRTAQADPDHDAHASGGIDPDHDTHAHGDTTEPDHDTPARGDTTDPDHDTRVGAAGFDRAGDERRRDPDWVAARHADPTARALLAGDDGVVLDGDRLALVALAATRGTAYLLGLEPDGRPLYAVDVDARDEARGPATAPPTPVGAGPPRGSSTPPPDSAAGPRPVGLRTAATVLSAHEGGLAAYAAALINWHRAHPFCPACGARTATAEAGLVRICPRCTTVGHPRTDPVVIMLVCDGDRLLLGRSPNWPPRRYSALAGFVEPGETLEAAVAREVFEESGVTVGPPRYIGSQAWPYPASLMIGFLADWSAGDPAPGEAEIDDVRWFDRAQIAAANAEDAAGWGGDEQTDAPLLLPPRMSIARRLIEHWLGAYLTR